MVTKKERGNKAETAHQCPSHTHPNNSDAANLKHNKKEMNISERIVDRIFCYAKIYVPQRLQYVRKILLFQLKPPIR
jgi:hypothetical protein